MKGIVPLSVLLSFCIGLASSEAGSKDEQPKQIYSNVNVIGSTPKPDILSYQQISQQYSNKYQPHQSLFQQQYQPRTQHLHQTLPYNHQPEHQPVAMVIIAQPAYVPVSMLQNGNVAQQLLQYFQGSNPQARYQIIPANHQPVYQQPYQMPVQTQQISQYVQYQQVNKPEPTHYPASVPVAQAQTSENQFLPHEALPTPQALVSQQHHIVPHHLSQPEGRSLHYQQAQQQVEYQPQQLQQIEQSAENQSPEITKLAQQAAQHFLMSGGFSGGSRISPAIITGLEHFSPEQQEKIKSQLSAHFGSPLKPLNLNGQNGQKQEATPSSKKFYQDQRHKINRDRFVPSIQVKDGEITQTSAIGLDKM